MSRLTSLLKHQLGRFLKFVTAAFMLCLGTVCAAAGLQVSPTTLELPAGETSSSVWLSNTSDTVLHAQVRIMGWEQRDGHEELAPSRALTASPPLVEVAPGERQLVRIVRLDKNVQPTERAFRLLIDELPHGPDQPVAQGLNFLLQYSLPVFLIPEASSADIQETPQLSAKLLSADEDFLQMSVQNSGMHRVRLRDLVWEDAQGTRTVVRVGLVGYVLAGQQMNFTIKFPSPLVLGTGMLKAIVNDDRGEKELLALDGGH
jgi:fimbrial chaperone protein